MNKMNPLFQFLGRLVGKFLGRKFLDDLLLKMFGKMMEQI